MMAAYVLLSGGIDSTVCLYFARKHHPGLVRAVSVYYGQRHDKEIRHAMETCRRFDITHAVVDLSGAMPKNVLTDKSVEIPNVSYADIRGVSPAYVPFRNGFMISAVTAYVQAARQREGSNDPWYIYFGAHAEDAHNWAYPDCTPEFVGVMTAAVYIGTYKAVQLVVPLQWFDKAQIIKLGDGLGVNWGDTWSCYKGGEWHCGICPTCRARRAGFKAAEVVDPTLYENVVP